MELFTLIAGLGFVIMALVVIWVSEQKQWSTLIAIFGIFATAVTGAYIFNVKAPSMANSISTSTTYSATVTSK